MSGGRLDFIDSCTCENVGGAAVLGEDFSRELTLTISDVLVNLSEATAQMQIRESIAAEAVILELNTENNRITLSSTGAITLFIDKADLALIPPKIYVYDLFITFANGRAEQLLKGKFELKYAVTREVLT